MEKTSAIHPAVYKLIISVMFVMIIFLVNRIQSDSPSTDPRLCTLCREIEAAKTEEGPQGVEHRAALHRKFVEQWEGAESFDDTQGKHRYIDCPRCTKEYEEISSRHLAWKQSLSSR